MPASKYEEQVEPNIGLICDMARSGADLKDISKAIGVSASALRRYMHSGDPRYKTLVEAYKQAMIPVKTLVESALIKRVIGCTVEEVEIAEVLDRNGEIHELKKVTTKEIPPDTQSIIFYLTNRFPELWQRQPMPVLNDGGNETGVLELPAVTEIKPPGGDDNDGNLDASA